MEYGLELQSGTALDSNDPSEETKEMLTDW
jgi:hypothetical protein